jgi:16S rRNA (cytidine(1402)-2'-O)-methyltransferase
MLQSLSQLSSVKLTRYLREQAAFWNFKLRAFIEVPEQAKKLIERAENDHLVYISDAGTPGISDPAYLLIQEAIEQNIKIEVIPGASALLTGTYWAGLHMHDFRFLGFLASQKRPTNTFKSLKEKDYTAIIYESPHRIEKTLSDLGNYFLMRISWYVLARELTKNTRNIPPRFSRKSTERSKKRCISRRNSYHLLIWFRDLFPTSFWAKCVFDCFMPE